MGLPYFPLYPKDYEAKTSHLTMLEDGAYNRLLRVCWMTPGCTLPADEAWIMRRVRAVTPDEIEAVKAVLAEFFTRDSDRLFQERLREEALLAENAHARRVEAGRKGGRKPTALKTNETGQSNSKPMPKQPEPEPYTVTNVTGAVAPVDFAKAIFEHGVRFLIEHGQTEPSARALIGKWRKGHEDAEIFQAFKAAKSAGVTDPKSYIAKTLGGENAPNTADRLQRVISAAAAGSSGKDWG